MINFIIHGFRQRATMRELNALSDRELSDLGIERAAIRAIVSRAAGATPSAKPFPHAWGAMAPSWASHNRRSLAV